MNKKGFTLIELLIVVAIIAILAAIAVPNFLEAQIRSKVSRAKSDIRSLATAVESYATDWNKVPPHTSDVSGSPYFDPRGSGLLGKWMTTPIAYISSLKLKDPFLPEHSGAEPEDEWWYTYHNIDLAGWTAPFRDYYGKWRLGSIGPDRTYWNKMPPPPKGGPYTGCNPQRPYDATNGTVSIGNVWRSQKQPECTSAPVGYFP